MLLKGVEHRTASEDEKSEAEDNVPCRLAKAICPRTSFIKTMVLARSISGQISQSTGYATLGSRRQTRRLAMRRGAHR